MDQKYLNDADNKKLIIQRYKFLSYLYSIEEIQKCKNKYISNATSLMDYDLGNENANRIRKANDVTELITRDLQHDNSKFAHITSSAIQRHHSEIQSSLVKSLSLKDRVSYFVCSKTIF